MRAGSIYYFYFFSLIFFLTSCRNENRKSELEGVWQLKSWTAIKNDSLTYPYGEDAAGQLIYHPNGQMSFMLAKNKRDLFGTDDRSQISAEQARKANNSFFAYWGTYNIDSENGTVTHKISFSLLPDWSNSVQERYYAIKGNSLVLTSDTVAGKTHRLVWLKVN